MHEKGGEIMVGRKVTVSNPSGLHIKPAGQLVKAAELGAAHSPCQSTIGETPINEYQGRRTLQIVIKNFR